MVCLQELKSHKTGSLSGNYTIAATSWSGKPSKLERVAILARGTEPVLTSEMLTGDRRPSKPVHRGSSWRCFDRLRLSANAIVTRPEVWASEGGFKSQRAARATR